MTTRRGELERRLLDFHRLERTNERRNERKKEPVFSSQVRAPHATQRELEKTENNEEQKCRDRGLKIAPVRIEIQEVVASLSFFGFVMCLLSLPNP